MKKFSLLSFLFLCNTVLPFYQNVWEQIRDQVSQNKFIIGCGAFFGGYVWYNYHLQKEKDAQIQQLLDAQIKKQNEKITKKIYYLHAQTTAQAIISATALFLHNKRNEDLRKQHLQVKKNVTDLGSKITSIQDTTNGFIPLFEALAARLDQNDELFVDLDDRLNKQQKIINTLSKLTGQLADKQTNLSTEIVINQEELAKIKTNLEALDDSMDDAIALSKFSFSRFEEHNGRLNEIENSHEQLEAKVGPLSDLYKQIKFGTARLKGTWSPGAGANSTHRKVSAIEWKKLEE